MVSLLCFALKSLDEAGQHGAIFHVDMFSLLPQQRRPKTAFRREAPWTMLCASWINEATSTTRRIIEIDSGSFPSCWCFLFYSSLIFLVPSDLVSAIIILHSSHWPLTTWTLADVLASENDPAWRSSDNAMFPKSRCASGCVLGCQRPDANPTTTYHNDLRNSEDASPDFAEVACWEIHQPQFIATSRSQWRITRVQCLVGTAENKQLVTYDDIETNSLIPTRTSSNGTLNSEWRAKAPAKSSKFKCLPCLFGVARVKYSWQRWHDMFSVSI